MNTSFRNELKRLDEAAKLFRPQLESMKTNLPSQSELAEFIKQNKLQFDWQAVEKPESMSQTEKSAYYYFFVVNGSIDPFCMHDDWFSVLNGNRLNNFFNPNETFTPEDVQKKIESSIDWLLGINDHIKVSFIILDKNDDIQC